MMQTIAVDKNIVVEILHMLKSLQQELTDIKTKLIEAPPYGSKEWWDWSIKRGLQEIDNGKYNTYKSIDAYVKSLNKRGNNHP